MKMASQPAAIVAISTLASMLLATDIAGLHAIGTGLAVILIVTAMHSFWLGLLALLPMLFSIDPAPATIGLPEGVFAALASTSLLGSLLQEFKEGGWNALTRRYAGAMAAASVFMLLNMYMANNNSVPFSDWARGIAPFLFLIFAMPFTYALAGRPDRLKWVGAGLALYTLLLMGQIVGFYLANRLYAPYWVVGHSDAAFRIFAEQLSQYPDASGPYMTRITMELKRSTTVLMGAGFTMAFVVATLSPNWRIRVTAGMLAALCITAELMTYTRSMIAVSGFTVCCFIILLTFRNRANLRRAAVLALLLAGWGWAAISLFNMGPMWTYRLSETVKTEQREQHQDGQDITSRLDENITSRLQELQLAWERFKEHPLLGNGLGIKNPVRYVGPDGPFEVQVAYIHNWFFYVLMVGGLLAWTMFVFLLSGPVLSRWRLAGRDVLANEVVRFGILSFAIYGLGFAVFRHIDFNLLVATAWGVILAARAEKVA